MSLRGPIAQPGSELPAHNRLVPGSNPGGPTSSMPFPGAGPLKLSKPDLPRLPVH
jgi:hypothetical protein